MGRLCKEDTRVRGINKGKAQDRGVWRRKIHKSDANLLGLKPGGVGEEEEEEDDDDEEEE